MVCRALQLVLEPHARLRGFVLADADPVDGADGSGIHLLEYRRQLQDGPVLLSVCELVGERTITAELWSPRDLRRGVPVASADAIAHRRRTWTYDGGSDADDVAQEVSSEVAGWLRALRD